MNDFNSTRTTLTWKIAFEMKGEKMVCRLVFCHLWSKQNLAEWL